MLTLLVSKQPARFLLVLTLGLLWYGALCWLLPTPSAAPVQALPQHRWLTARPLIAAGAPWQYLDTGVDLGVGWRALPFNDGAWATGNTELGYGDQDETTLVGF